MPSVKFSLAAAPRPLEQGLEKLARDLELPREFPDEVLQEADDVVRDGPDISQHVDKTDLEMVTIDPPGSMDLDQALFIERRGRGYRVWYAIADVAAWAKPGGAIDQEAHRRGQTYYAPNFRIPLHPPVLSEDAASLHADGRPRPATLWRIDLDSEGEVETFAVRRAMVRNREKMTYAHVQEQIAENKASESLNLLREVGMLRQYIEIKRGGISLDLPEQEVVAQGPTKRDWRLQFRESLPVEGWNAQISLLTGICAATMMIDAQQGILRTLPPAREEDVEKLRRIAYSMHLPWPASMSYPEFVRSIDPRDPDGQAMMNACTLLFRGAGYTVIDSERSHQLDVHAALATPYAHTTAPLRRLVDRYTAAICLALHVGEKVPGWVQERQAQIPKDMGRSDQRAKRFERKVVDFVEALVLNGRIGQHMVGTVIDLDDREPNRAVFSVPGVAVEAPIKGDDLQLGRRMEAELVEADPATGKVLFRAL